MVAMGLSGFGLLLLVGFLGSFTVHVLFRYRVLQGPDGFLSAWIVGWLGAWLGTLIFGRWGPHVGAEYLLPALLGAFVLPFVIVAGLRALGRVLQTPQTEMGPSRTGSERVEMRKAS